MCVTRHIQEEAWKAWKYTARVLNGMNAGQLRKNITAAAEDSLGFGGHIQYPSAPAFLEGCSSQLDIELYFMSETDPHTFNAKLERLVARYDNPMLRVADVEISESSHHFNLASQITVNTYKPGDSPGREVKTIPAPESTPVTTMVTDPAVIEKESLGEVFLYTPARGPEACHILEKGWDGGDDDQANMLVMHKGLRQLYDGRATIDDRCPPAMSVFCHENDLPTGDYDTEYAPVTLRVVFDNAHVAAYESRGLRNRTKLHDRLFQCVIEKKNATLFVRNLNRRHATNVERNGLLRDPTNFELLLEKNARSDVANLSDVIAE